MVGIPKGYLKFAGWSLGIGGLMGFAGQLIHIGDTPGSVDKIPRFLDIAVNTHVLLAWASIFVLMGLPAIYLRQAAKLKTWGWIGFPLLFVGMMLEIFHGPLQVMGYPIIYSSVSNEAVLNTVNDQVSNMTEMAHYPAAYSWFIPIIPGIFLGLLILGIATIRAKVLHKGYGIFALVVLVLLGGGMSAPDLPTFALVHLVFVMFGVKLAFEKKTDVPAEEQLAA
ncbi:hypothetical protein [Cohnella sp. AR92]|uniref:hypothetical protein n=1 Tax=Cohnella sp. AR92 TaxID=648716 RepID=UPI000F8ED873|nr:hypothetical protein [Cohnella sp. AR92]RUS47349.1 hypothetical protein ELR57_09490 [Cohnella sp. AR92]